MSAILRRHHVPYLRECDPLTGEVIRASKTTAVRYEHPYPGSLVHMDVKKIGKIPDGGGWKAHGRQMGRTGAQKRAKIGFDYVHSLVDDHCRLAYSEILPDEKGPTCAAFLLRAAAYFASFGITRLERVMTDNHFSDKLSTDVAKAMTDLDAKHVFIRPATLAERQGRALQPHAAGRVGIPAGLPHQRRAQQRSCPGSSSTTLDDATQPSEACPPISRLP